MLATDSSTKDLREAYKAQNLTLYLGAGVSVANGLPTWNQLILAMYFTAISDARMEGWRPFPNYLYAIAEYQLKRSQEPLEIMARKIRKYYPTPSDFLENLRQTLYQGFSIEGAPSGHFQHFYKDNVLQANPTLAAVSDLCLRKKPTAGVHSVITYNYDDLLEQVLDTTPHQPIFRQDQKLTEGLPIYHVHGYVPMGDSVGSPGEDIVFTEDQYHQSALDPYSWRNLVQVQALSRSVGLMVGLSLSDRNMRRFLDAVKRSPVRSKNFAILRKPRYQEPSDQDLDQIHQKAISYLKKFENSGIKASGHSREQALYSNPGIKASHPILRGTPAIKGEPQYRREIRGILQAVEQFDAGEQAFVLEDLGITPIWYESYSDIPAILKSISTP